MGRRASLEKTKSSYKSQPGDLVFAKVKGYPAWPARVQLAPPLGIKPSAVRIPVVFFGTNESAMVAPNDLFPYLQYKDTLGRAKKHRNFLKGMEEIEAEYQRSNGVIHVDENKLKDIQSNQSNDSAMESDEDVFGKKSLQKEEENSSKSIFDEKEHAVTKIELNKYSELDDKAQNIDKDSNPNDILNKEKERTYIEQLVQSSAHVEAKKNETQKTDAILNLLSEEYNSADSEISDEHALVIDEIDNNKKNFKSKYLNGRSRPCHSNKSSNVKPKRISSSSINGEKKSLRKTLPVDTTPSNVKTLIEETESTIERSRSGRMIKRKRLDDFEEDDFYLNNKRQKIDINKNLHSAAIGPSKPEPLDTKESEDSNLSFDDYSEKLDKISSKKKVSRKNHKNLSKEEITAKLFESSSNGDSSDGFQDNQTSLAQAKNNTDEKKDPLFDLSSEKKREKLKRKLEMKEQEKEKRKFEKLKQKRQERMEKWRAILITPDVLKDIENEIIESLDVENKNHKRCIHVLEKLDIMSVTQDHLTSYNSILQTLKKCRKYKEDEEVRQKAGMIFEKFKLLFKPNTNDSQTILNSISSLSDTKNTPTATATTDEKNAPYLDQIKQLMDDCLKKIS